MYHFSRRLRDFGSDDGTYHGANRLLTYPATTSSCLRVGHMTAVGRNTSLNDWRVVLGNPFNSQRQVRRDEQNIRGDDFASPMASAHVAFGLCLGVFVWQSHRSSIIDTVRLLYNMFGRILLVVATIFLFHDLSHLKALGKPEGSLPLNTVYESIVALILGTLGASLNAPPLKDITWASEMNKRTIDDMDSRLGFANYHSRGKSFLVPLPSGQP
ncbi:hypothetical protein J3R82DRAFT_2524 [Butyriboletus roseoflavus]|nr:hypothetical protein J3R82DRAFT_2524 [Butyriboletus roseoflavus]